MADRRQEILDAKYDAWIVNKYGTDHKYKMKFSDYDTHNMIAKQAMDEYMEVTVLEAFDYVAKHVQNTMITDAGVSMFLVDNNWIEKEELFKNFL